jgi:hypothetical protein
MAVAGIPALMLFTMLSLSLSKFYNELEGEQRVLDNAAQLAGAVLPDADLAEGRAQDYVARQTRMAGNLSVNIRPEGVELLKSGEYRFLLGDFLGLNLSTPYQLGASARPVPLNLVLAMDISAYMAPDPSSADNWGGNNYPAADYISDYFELAGLKNLGAMPAILTSQCFNPLLLMLKRVALETIGFVKAATVNNLAVTAFPGRNFHYDEIYYQGRGLTGLLSQYTFDYKAAAFCGAAAEREFTTAAYNFPVSSSGADAEKFFDPVTLEFDSEQMPDLLPEEVVWGLGAGQNTFPADLNGIFSNLIASVSGGLSPQAANKVVILSGDVPHEGAARYPDATARTALLEGLGLLRQLADISKSRIKFYYLIGKTPERQIFSDEEAAELTADLNEVFADSEYFKPLVRVLDSQSDLNAEIYRVLLDEQAILLAK